MAKDKRVNIKRLISRSVTIICLGVFIYAAYGLVDVGIDYYQNRQVLSSAQDTFYNAVSADNDIASSHGEIRSEFKGLLDDNADVAGWITIEGTQIDYPVLQTTNNETYLTQNFNKDTSIAGSIYLDYRNDIESSDLNTVVYGHRMKDGSMFQHLAKFMDKDFFDNHQTFEFETLYGSYEAEIFAVYNTLTTFDYIKTDFDSDEEYEELLTNIQNESKYQTGVDVSTDDHIITLSTCDYQLDKNEGRLVVQAKLTKR